MIFLPSLFITIIANVEREREIDRENISIWGLPHALTANMKGIQTKTHELVNGHQMTHKAAVS